MDNVRIRQHGGAFLQPML